MDKRILQTYSIWAKENLEKQIEVSLKTLGINGDKDIKNAKKIGDFTKIDGDSNSYPADLLEKRKHIVALVTEKGYKNVIEEFAYTWLTVLWLCALWRCTTFFRTDSAYFQTEAEVWNRKS